MKLSNHKNSPNSFYKLLYRLSLSLPSDMLKPEHINARWRVSYNPTGRTVTLKADPGAAYLWGKETLNGDRQLSPCHDDRAIPLFGATELLPTMVTVDTDRIIIHLPSALAPARTVKPRAPRQHTATSATAAITLREAVAAVNSHKERMGDDLALSITPTGALRALIEYS